MKKNVIYTSEKKSYKIMDSIRFFISKKKYWRYFKRKYF